MDPTRTDAAWLDFQKAYRTKFNEEPDAYAAYAFDGMNILIGAIEKAGLNRGRVMDALRDYQTHDYNGVAGRAQFDHTLNNIAPITMARVQDGKFVYTPATMQAAPVSASAQESAGDK
jgi:branched-chain amino acid transport system substrate-binding protein